MKTMRLAIIVCALGYFMDVFDFNLFTVLRVASLNDLGIFRDAQLTVASYILDAQSLGLLLGAFLWGYLGDRFGRLKALYGSIFVYSMATLGCSAVSDPVTYGLLRFFAGFGIAGEVGAATTLISELMHAKKRGWGVAIIAGFGTFGPAAAVLGSWFLQWRLTYVIGGVLGLVLLVLRMRLAESGLYEKISLGDNCLGSLKLLLQPKQALILVSCIFIATSGTYPNWFLNFFSLELSHAILAPAETFNQKTCLLLFYIGLGLGHGFSIIASQLLRSRIKALGCFMLIAFITTAFCLIAGPAIGLTATTFYSIYFILGVMSGSWSLAILVGDEHSAPISAQRPQLWSVTFLVSGSFQCYSFFVNSEIPLVFPPQLP